MRRAALGRCCCCWETPPLWMASNRKQPRSFVLLCASRRSSRSLESASAGMQLPSPGSRRQSGFHAAARAALANDNQLRLNVSAGGGGAAGKHRSKRPSCCCCCCCPRRRKFTQLSWFLAPTGTARINSCSFLIMKPKNLSSSKLEKWFLWKTDYSFNLLSTLTRQK